MLGKKIAKNTRNTNSGPISICVFLQYFYQNWVNGLDLDRYCAPEHICELRFLSIVLDFDFCWKSVLDINDITYYILLVDCLLIAYRLPLMPICSAIIDMGSGPEELNIPGTLLGPWARGPGPGPGPISIMAEHMGIKGNQ